MTNFAARALVSVIGGFFNSLAIVIVLLVFNWKIGLIAAAGVLVYLAATELAVRKSTALSSARQHTQESLVESVLEYVQGMGIVKAFGAEKNSTQSVTGAIRESCRNNLKLTYACVPYDALKQIVVRVFSFLLLLVSVSFYINGTLSLTYSLLMVIASFLVFNDLEGAGNMASLLQMLAASMDTVNAMEDMPVMDEKGSNVAVKDNNIVFDNVKFSYADRKILDGVSFTIPEKTTTAIVGPSGAGKTAMCNLIARFWDVDGGTLSGGEKQRISIARAMLKDAPIIILDEATSSVDPENEEELQHAIEALTHDKTIIMIAHRLKTVRNADRILVLSDAHIVQRGTHEQLIGKKGLYADFVSARQEANGWKLA